MKNKVTFWLPMQVFAYIDDATAGANTVKKNPWGDPPPTASPTSGAAERDARTTGLLLALISLAIGVLPAIVLSTG